MLPALGRTRAVLVNSPTPSGIRRRDLFVAVLLVVLALVFLAHNGRYTITQQRDGDFVVFQRTDHWLGRAEVYALGSKQVRPDWVKLAPTTNGQ